MNESIFHTLAALGAVGITCQWLAWWVKLPAILFLLLAGIVAGPVLGVFDPDAIFGELLFPVVSLSVAVILFEGSLTLRFDEVRGVGQVIHNLLTIGVAVTWVITAVATHLLMQVSWDLSFLFGALVVVTGPTVVVPILRTVRPNARIANLLRWEGILIDPVGAILAVIVYEFIVSGQAEGAIGHTIVMFGSVMVTGLLTGVLAGYVWGEVLRRFWLPEYLHSVATLTFVLAIFAISNSIFEESGLLTVTVMGVWLANMRDVPIAKILDFKESVTILLISILFLILAARIELSDIVALGWSSLALLAVIQFVARPAKVFVSTIGSDLTLNEKALMSWIAPRGIVAAAVSSLFGLRLEEYGYDFAPYLAPLTFLIIVGTVALQSLTAGPLARWLKVAEPAPRGFLLIGANPVARAIGTALKENGYRVLLADTNWESISKARMEGLSTYYGNPISDHADRSLDLVGIGRLLALSPQQELNVLSAMRYRSEFGHAGVYALQTSAQKTASEKHKASEQYRGKTLFGEDVTYSKLASLLSGGAEIKSTPLTDKFLMVDYYETYEGRAIPMFTINNKGDIDIFVAKNLVEPKEGCTVLGLAPVT